MQCFCKRLSTQDKKSHYDSKKDIRKFSKYTDLKNIWFEHHMTFLIMDFSYSPIRCFCKISWLDSYTIFYYLSPILPLYGIEFYKSMAKFDWPKCKILQFYWLEYFRIQFHIMAI
uniref:Uncharacterized protein n=1 Tax=Cacopsylla melanoneura TaxID=428564 RepID=A0A8D8WIN3_9HEMI